jgi:hypothetical protein
MAKKEFKRSLMHKTRKELADFILKGDEIAQKSWGYEGESKRRKVGDVWEDEFWRYEQMEGFVSKTGKNHEIYQDIRNYLKSKSECQNSECEKQKFGPTDRMIISQTGYCVDCLAKFEADIKLEGLWESYEKWRMMRKAIAVAEDAKKQIEQGIKDLTPHYEFVQENGTIEKWTLPKPMDEMKKEMEEEIQNIDNGLTELREDIVTHESILKQSNNSYIKQLISQK